MSKDRLPTVFHITHWKSGSQWVLAVLSQCAGSRVVKPRVNVAHFYEDPLLPGAIYPTIYVPQPRFQNTLMPQLDLDAKNFRPTKSGSSEVQNWYNFKVRKAPVIKFVVIRDLRDALVSHYFSLKISHPIVAERIAEGRQLLNELDLEDGLLHTISSRGKVHANIQRSWLPICNRGDALLVRYEDLIADEKEWFAKIIDYSKINVSKRKLESIVEKNSFSNKTGRQPGDEDMSSHYRKGISGNWKNYFTENIKNQFKQEFGQLLIDAGYEKDLNW